MNTQLRQTIKEIQPRSAWQKGLITYAIDIIDDATEQGIALTAENLKGFMLNGADSFQQASEGGNYLIYDYDIAEAVCTPSELKRTDNGRLNPNSHENWLDVQTRALHQTYNLLKRNLTEATA